MLMLKEEHHQVRDMVRRFADEVVAPRARDLDETETFPVDTVKQMAELGLMGLPFPEKYGGAGMDTLSYAIAVEELARVCASTAITLAAHVSLGCGPVYGAGSEEQKRRFLTPMAKGEAIGAFGLTEPNAGSDAVGIQTTAVRKGDRYVLNGEKTWISLADVADHYLVIAWTDQEKKKNRDHSGLSAFIVERAFKGFSSYTLKEKWGILAGNTGGFHLEDVEVPVENRVGAEGEGFKVAMFALENGRFTVAAGATGLVRACLDASLKYAKERKTFGVPIGDHQLVKEMLSQMVSDYDAARLLWLRAGWLKNEGRRNNRETSLAKWFATVASERAASDAVQIHGGNGFSDEYPVGRFYRNCKAAVIYEGTREIHKLMQADYALGNRQDKPRRVNLPAYKR